MCVDVPSDCLLCQQLIIHVTGKQGGLNYV